MVRPMDESLIPQNRRSRRSNVLLAATIEAFDEVIAVKLRNLSTEGALIEGKNLPPEGSVVVFRRNELSVESHIAWVIGDQAGVAFTRPIAREDVLRNIPSPRSREPAKCARPQLAYRGLTPAELRLAQSWAVPLPHSSPSD